MNTKFFKMFAVSIVAVGLLAGAAFAQTPPKATHGTFKGEYEPESVSAETVEGATASFTGNAVTIKIPGQSDITLTGLSFKEFKSPHTPKGMKGFIAKSGKNTVSVGYEEATPSKASINIQIDEQGSFSGEKE